MRNYCGMLALAAGLLLALATAAGAQEKPAGGQKEGIKVHGQWTIEVRNPDGSLSWRSEFHNDLQPRGGVTLVYALARQSRIGGWGVSVGGSMLCQAGIGGGRCFALQPDDVSVSVSPEQALVLNATMVADTAGTLENVATHLGSCGLAGPDCPVELIDTQNAFSSAVIPAKQIAAGQIIQVTVVISFS